MLSWAPKNPSDVVDCEIDWRLEDDRIIKSRWEVPPGIVGSRASHDSTVTTIWLAGGMLGGRYVLTNSIVTAQGRDITRLVRIKIKAR